MRPRGEERVAGRRVVRGDPGAPGDQVVDDDRLAVDDDRAAIRAYRKLRVRRSRIGRCPRDTDRSELSERIESPDRHRAPSVGYGHPIPVRDEPDVSEGERSRKVPQLGVTGRTYIPDLHGGAVGGAGEHPVPVRRERHAADPAGHLRRRQRHELPALVLADLPYLRGPLVTSGDDARSIGAPRNRPDERPLAPQLVLDAPRPRVPGLDHAAGSDRGDRSVVGAPGQCVDEFGAMELDHASPVETSMITTPPSSSATAIIRPSALRAASSTG